MIKWPVQKQTQNSTNTRRTPRRNSHSEKNTIFCVFQIFLFLFIINDFFFSLQEMLSYRIGTVNDFHGGFKPV